MLAVNSKPLDFNDPKCPYVKRVNEAVEKLYGMNMNIIRLSYTERHKRRNPEDPNMVERAVRVRIPTEVTFVYEGVTETWTWYETSKVSSDGRIDNYKPTAKNFLGNETFYKGKSDKTLLYFMVFCTPSCAKIPSLKDMQNPDVKMASWYVELPEIEAMDRAEMDKLAGEIYNRIYKSDISDAILWAKAMGISGADLMQEMTLRTTLAKIAMISKDNMNKFLETSLNKDIVYIRATITDAMACGLIGMDKRGGRIVWRMKKDNKFDAELCRVEPGNDEQKTIEQYFIMNPANREKIIELTNALKKQNE